MSEPDELRARESAILRALDEGRSELEQIADEIARLEAALPGLRERAEIALRHATEVKKKEYDTPAKVIITVCVVPVAILLGVVAALFGWMFVAIPGLVFELDPGLMLHVLPALMGVFGLCGGVYAALKIWG
jgi:hypothetical protein